MEARERRERGKGRRQEGEWEREERREDPRPDLSEEGYAVLV